MGIDYYKQVIQRKDQQDIGIVLGLAIRDKDISPEVYAVLCKFAKEIGFKFASIIFAR